MLCNELSISVIIETRHLPLDVQAGGQEERIILKFRTFIIQQRNKSFFWNIINFTFIFFVTVIQ